MTTLETPRVLQNAWKTVLAWGVLTLILGVVILLEFRSYAAAAAQASS